MAITCIAFIAASLDGYIAKVDGNIDWLHNPKYAIGDEDYGYDRHFSNIDGLVMGRNTYELALSFDKWPYFDKPVYVLSSRVPSIPSALVSSVKILGGKIPSVMEQLSKNGHERLYIDGGKTIQGFINNGALDEITITRIPILLGKGIPLFSGLEREVALKHIFTKSYDNGFVQSKYLIESGA